MDYTELSLDCMKCSEAGAYYIRFADVKLAICTPLLSIVKGTMTTVVEPFSAEVCPVDPTSTALVVADNSWVMAGKTGKKTSF